MKFYIFLLLANLLTTHVYSCSSNTELNRLIGIFFSENSVERKKALDRIRLLSENGHFSAKHWLERQQPRIGDFEDLLSHKDRSDRSPSSSTSSEPCLTPTFFQLDGGESSKPPSSVFSHSWLAPPALHLDEGKSGEEEYGKGNPFIASVPHKLEDLIKCFNENIEYNDREKAYAQLKTIQSLAEKQNIPAQGWLIENQELVFQLMTEFDIQQAQTPPLSYVESNPLSSHENCPPPYASNIVRELYHPSNTSSLQSIEHLCREAQSSTNLQKAFDLFRKLPNVSFLSTETSSKRSLHTLAEENFINPIISKTLDEAKKHPLLKDYITHINNLYKITWALSLNIYKDDCLHITYGTKDKILRTIIENIVTHQEKNIEQRVLIIFNSLIRMLSYILDPSDVSLFCREEG